MAAQSEESAVPEGVDMGLVHELCAATADDETELTACMDSVESALTQMLSVQPDEEGASLLDRAQGLLDDAQTFFDDTLAEAREIDLQAALDDAVQSAKDFELDIDVDVQGAIDDAVAAIDDLDLDVDIDVQQAIDDAVAEVLTATEDIDLEAAIDEALAGAQAAIDDADLEAVVADAVVALEDSVVEARAVVGAAQQWAQENADVVCRGSSVSLGTTVGVAVFALTGVEWLGLQAFWATERFTHGFCGDLVD
ncbi:MAG: hypothetical protein U9O18_03895 [Chloroflexota bacterium]|nr:hypothetical protein [Chloroflexota bacterium]